VLVLRSADTTAPIFQAGHAGSIPVARSAIPAQAAGLVTAVRILLQRTKDPKVFKERMHLDIETDDVEAEVTRFEALGASRWDHQQERGYDFWVMRDPSDNEFSVLQTEFPDLLAKLDPWTDPA
jgi:hypothetical protein